MEKPLQTLHRSLLSNNYDVPEDYDSFEKTLTAKGNEGYQNRRTLWQSLKDNNYDVPDDYETFSTTLFAPVKKSQSTPAYVPPTQQKQAAAAKPQIQTVSVQAPVTPVVEAAEEDKPENRVLGTPWGSQGSAIGQSRAYKPFSPGQVRTTDDPDAEQFGTPYKPQSQLTYAQRDEIKKQNDWAARQIEKMRKAQARREQPLVDTGNEEVNQHIIKTQGEWDNELASSANRISSSVVIPAVDKAIADFDKKAHEVFEGSQEGNTRNLPTGVASGATIFGNIREANQAKDPEKVLQYLQQQMESVYKNSDFVEQIGKEADKLGIDRSEYLEEVIKPQIQNDLTKRFESSMIARELPKSGLEYVVSGLNNSIVGMIADTFLNTKSQRAYKNQAQAMTEEGDNPYYNPSTAASLAKVGVTFAADAPFFGVYGRVGGQVVKNIAEREIQNMMAKGLSESAARSIVGTALENSAGARMKNYIMQHVVSGAITMGGFNATSEGVRQVRDDDYNALRFLGSTAEGVATGAAFGLTGGAVQALSQPLSGFSKLGAKVAGFGAEAETMYATEEAAKALQGEDAFENPFEGSVESLMKLGVMKASSPGGIFKVIGEVAHPIKSNQRNHTGISFTPEEEAYVRGEGQNLLQALSNMHPERAISDVNGKKKLTKEGEQMRQQLAEAYNGFMGNTEIPANVKQKVAQTLGGVYRPGLETGADIIQNEDGSVVIKTRDQEGNCIQEIPFENYDQATEWQQQFKSQMSRNDATNMYNGASLETKQRIVDIVRDLVSGKSELENTLDRANGMRQNRMKRELEKYNQLTEKYAGREMTDEEARNYIQMVIKDGSDEVFNDLYNIIRQEAYPADELNTKRNYWEGRQIPDLDKHIAQVDAQLAEEQLMLLGEDFANEVMAAEDYPDEKMMELASRRDVSGAQLKAALDYYNKVSKLNGMMDETLKSIDDQVKAANAYVDRNTHPDSQSIIEVQDNDGKTYYVSAGHIQITPEGKLVGTDNTGMVILRDVNTGEIFTKSPSEVTVSAVKDPQMLKDANESMEGLRGELMAKANETIEINPETPETPQEMGETFMGADGKMYMVAGQPDETGQIIWTKFELDEQGNPTGEPQPLDIAEYRKAKSDEIDAATMSQSGPVSEYDTPVIEPTETPIEQELAKNEQEQTVIEQPQAGIEQPETPQEPQNKIPVNDKQEPQFEQAKPEDTLAELNSRYGEEKAQKMISQIAQATAKELEKLESEDTSGITDMAELMQHEDKVKELQQKYDYWNNLIKKEEPVAETPVVEVPVAETAPVVESEKPVTEESVVKDNLTTEQSVTEPETPADIKPEEPETPIQEPEQPVVPEKSAQQKVNEAAVSKNIGKHFTYTDNSGMRTSISIDKVTDDGKVVVTRQDFDADGKPMDKPKQQTFEADRIGQGIIEGMWKPVASTEEKLRETFKGKVAMQNMIDVLSEEEQQRMLDTYNSGDQEAFYELMNEFRENHREDMVLRERDSRNDSVDRILNGAGSREDKLRRVRKQFQGWDDAEVMLSDEALQPTTLEEYVSDLHSRVPQRGEGQIAYYSYGDGADKVIGLQDETGYGVKSGADTKGFAPWLAPKGKGMSLQKYAETIHSQLPEAIQQQYSDQDVRNAILDVFGAAQTPSDIPLMVIRRGVLQAEQAARRMEEAIIDGDISYQKADRSFANRLRRAVEQTSKEPTEKQKEAGNYAKGHLSFGGYHFSVENPKGSIRRGTDASGKEWETKMNNTYGYILGKKGKDGDHLDMFINDNADLDNWNGNVYVVDQIDPKTGKFDESKILYGFNSEEEARQAYLSNYAKGWKGLGEITGVDKDTFDKWLDSSDRQQKEFAKHSIIKHKVESQVKTFDQAVSDLSKKGLSIDDKDLLDKYGLKSVTLSKRGDVVSMTHLVAEKMGEGSGTRFMNDLARLADEKGWTLALTPGLGLGAKSKRRLEQFYKRFGFVPNRGRNADFSTMEAMIRHPKEWNPEAPERQEQLLRDAVVDHLRSQGVNVSTDWQEGQRILDKYNGTDDVMKMAVDTNTPEYQQKVKEAEVRINKRLDEYKKMKGETSQPASRIPKMESTSPQQSGGKGSSPSGAKINKKLQSSKELAEKMADFIENLPNNTEITPESFPLDVIRALEVPEQRGQKSQYAYVKSDDGKTYTIRISDHSGNARHIIIKGVRTDEGYSIVLETPDSENKKFKKNKWAKVHEYTYDNPTKDTMLDIAKSIFGLLDSGEYVDVGKAKLYDISPRVMQHKAYHGSGAEFDKFDHSHMGEGAGSQTFGYGTYLTDSQKIGEDYANLVSKGWGYQGKHLDEIDSTYDGKNHKSNTVREILSAMNHGDTFEEAQERQINFLKSEIRDYEDEINELSEADKKDLNDLKKILNFVESLKPEDFKKDGRFLYDVEIPDEGGAYYIDNKGKMGNQKEILDMVDNALTADGWKRQELDSRIKFTKDGKQIILTPNQSGADLYAELQDALGSDKAASEFLHKVGVTGIKYPAGTIYGGGEGATNFVIFDEKDANITNTLQFFKTPDGHAYGYTYKGKIYVDPRIATAETPIHEYGHLWVQAKRASNPKEWNEIKQTMLNDPLVQPIIDKVRQQYPELNKEGKEDLFAEEIITQFSGKRGNERLHEIAEEVAKENGGIFGKAEAVTAMQRLKNILNRFWEGVAKMMGWKYRNANQIADKIMADLLNGVDPRQSVRKRASQILAQQKAEAPIFVSNAMKAVEGIKQEKATPEQWLAMIEKSGGLKAGEDKWIGLSDWLKEQQKDKKSITKQDLQDYIRQNQIQVEERRYVEGMPEKSQFLLDQFNQEFEELLWEGENETGSIYAGDWADWAFDQMKERYGDDFASAFDIEGSGSNSHLVPALDFSDEISDAAKYYLQMGEYGDAGTINLTRLDYTTNGLSDKREIALTVPTVEPYNESDEVHFGDAGDGRAIAWVRFGDAYDTDGKRVLVVDEIQSKRHQDAREKGYIEKPRQEEIDRANEETQKYGNFLYDKYIKGQHEGEDFLDYATQEEKDKFWELANKSNALKHPEGVPQAPFEKNWHELAMKRILRLAAEEGYDKVAWTTGAQQADRYNIGNKVSKITVIPEEDGDRIVSLYFKHDDGYLDFSQMEVDSEGKVIHGDFSGRVLSEVVGKDLAVKLLAAKENQEFKDNNLRIGGEGMKGFYDDMLPRFMNKYGKKWGVKVGEVEMPELGDDDRIMHSIDVTPEMKESVMQGQPMFQKAASDMDKTLMGMHNISETNLKKALKLGGLANPSMAVVDTKNGTLDNFGEISLIPKSDLIDRNKGRNAGTWAADAYTPRFPKTYLRISDKNRKNLNKWIDSLDINDEMKYTLSQQFNDYYNGFSIKDNALQYAFLHDKGLSDKVDYVRHDDVVPKFLELVEKYGDNIEQMIMRTRDDEDFRNEISESVLSFEISNAMKDIRRNEGETAREYMDRRKKYASVIRKMLTDDNDIATFDLTDHFLRTNAMKMKENGKFDPRETLWQAANYIMKNGLEKEYAKYFVDKCKDLGIEEMVANGHDRNGHLKFKPINLEDISKQMKKEGRAGGEGGFGDSPGALRAKLAPMLDSLEAMRREKGRLVSHDDFEAEKDPYFHEVFHIQNDLFGGDFDDMLKVLRTSDMEATAKRLGYEFSPEEVDDLKVFKNLTMNLPTEYFETKFERPVKFNEFEIAVVPQNTDPKVVDALKDAGLDVRKYESHDDNPEGTRNNRTQTIMDAVMDRDDIMFQMVGEKGAAEADKAEGVNTRQESLNIADSMEKDGKDSRAIKLATGWERGKDGKWRYETVDEKADILNDYNQKIVDYNNKRADFHKEQGRLLDLYDRMGTKIPKRLDSKKYSEEEQAKFREMRKEREKVWKQYMASNDQEKELVNNARDGHTTKLVDLLGENHELFKYYPQLKDVAVRYAKNMQQGVAGSYNDKDGIKISIDQMHVFGDNKDLNNDNVNGILVHEIQHAIQDIEGFAKGGNLYTATSEAGINAIVQKKQAEQAAIANKIDMFNKWLNNPEELKLISQLDRRTVDEEKRHLEEQLDDLTYQYDRIGMYIDKIKHDKAPALSDARDLYSRLAGEVEARNASERINMSEEERRKTPIEKTEDYARENQVVMMEYPEGGDEGLISFQKVDDTDELKKLESEPTVKRYRAMQLIDGKLYPPMSAKVDGQMRQPTEIGVWEKAEERPDLIKNGKFVLNKAQKGQSNVPAAYNPYFHTSTSGLNDQFTSAYKRPELVVVEVEIPESELTSGYKAEGAKDAVGNVDWHSGVVNGQLPADRQRQVTLSRYSKVNRVVPDSEVADMIAKQLDGTDITVPYNVVTPSLRAELEKKGVVISDKPAGSVTEDANGNPIRYQKVDKPVFYSNAEKAVEDIKQEKGTPEQWLAMIQKNGGLKAGEDKWLGLSDWLNEQKQAGKSVTKQDILDYIRKNQIQIEETHYQNFNSSDNPKLKEFNDEYQQNFIKAMKEMRAVAKEYDAFDDEMLEKYGEGWVNKLEGEDKKRNEALEERYAAYKNPEEAAFKMMVDKYGDDFELAFETFNHELIPITNYYDEPNEAAKYFLGAEDAINSTRLSYTTDGLNNKREIALTVPSIEPYKESDEIHFGDAGGGRAVAWVRFGETYAPKMGGDPNSLADGVSKVLVIDEIQSKRHQDGRDNGYSPSAKERNKLKEDLYDSAKKRDKYFEELTDKYDVGTLTALRGKATAEELAKYQQLMDITDEKLMKYETANKSKVPAAPFEKNWHELAMKRMLRYAAEKGYDKIAWTTGQQQADRYDLSNYVLGIISKDEGETKRVVVAFNNNDNSLGMDVSKENGMIVSGNYEGHNLGEVVGKEMAAKIMASEGTANFDGENLSVGGEGMKGFYDDILVRFMNKYGKKWGVKVDKTELPDIGQTMWSIDVTPEMKESVIQGQPMFQREGTPEGELTPEERQYWNKWDADMKKWRERNAIPEGVDGPGEKPKFRQGESALDFAQRLMDHNRAKALWQTAPKLENYRQRRDDKDLLQAARENEQRYPDSPSAKMRRVAAELQQIRHAMSQQKAYDKATVKAVTDFAQDFMKMGFGDNLSRGEMERMLSSVKNATGAKDIKREVDNILNILMDNHLRNLDQKIVKLSSVKELSKTAQGVEKQGKLELKGQRMIQAFREAREGRMDAEKIRERMNEVAEKMARNDEEAPMWEQEYEGLSTALQYAENIEASRDEWAELDREYKDAVKNYKTSGRSYKAQQELLESLDQAMMENKIERIGMFGDIIGRLEGNIAESVQGAKEFVEREKERVKHIQKLANFDLAGKPADAFRESSKGKPANFFLQPLGTFEQMLKMFGSRNAKGEGNLYDYFMRSWVDSTEKAFLGEQKAKEELDAKAREVFGDKVKRWSDLYEIARRLPTMDVELLDGENPKTFTLNQGNLMYIYMADKMTDGRMKLRKMGIDEEAVQQIKDFLDPRLVQLADWIQDDYLVKKRTEYNKVHERMFGAPMAAIDHYFPIKILGDARVQEQDVANMADQDAVLPSTITGNIIKRRKNALPLDILHTDALSLAIEHVEDMERWAATAEWNKDINTLLSYTTFRNKVKNMNTIYGSGDALWNSFADTARMAAGTYKPKAKPGSVDATISNIAKGVTAAKINFRVYTAFKQILSAPAFLHDVDLGKFVHDAANPYGSWKWAMENLPIFKKRWKSRQVGDTRLMDDPTDWKLWKTNIVKMATRMGMSPNALVDGVTCAVGAKAIYESRYKQYKDIGASDEVARKRALQDAEIGYNLTQQSSEGAFVSAIQKDRTVAANMLSVFRNSSMAYTRQWVDAARNLNHRMQKGYKEDSIEFMTRQFQDQFGLDEDKARQAAEAEYNRAGRHEFAKMLNMMFGVTMAWNLGASLPYLLMGDDDKTKKEMLKDATIRGMIAGPSEGFAAGNLISEMVSRTIANEQFRKSLNDGWGAAVDTAIDQGGDYEINPLPLMADLQNMIKKLGYDKFAAAQDVLNICMQSAVGVNPQTFTDMWNACMDYGAPGWDGRNYAPDDKNFAKPKEIALFIMRLMNAPTSSWKNKYIDELGMDVEDAKKLPYDEMARRYAHYKHWKETPILGWLRGEEARNAKIDKLQVQFDKAVNERMERLSDEELQYNVAHSDNAEDKRKFAKLIAKRLGIDPGASAKKPEESQWYQEVYQQYMQYDDIREDETLASKVKDVRDESAKKEINKRLKWIREGKFEETKDGKKKAKGDLLAPGKKQLETNGDEKRNQEILSNIRKWRKEALEIALKAEAE